MLRFVSTTPSTTTVLCPSCDQMHRMMRVQTKAAKTINCACGATIAFFDEAIKVQNRVDESRSANYSSPNSSRH
jgi:hypothetical protein